MLVQNYPLPYDVWLCSERPTEEIVSWCVARGVGGIHPVRRRAPISPGSSGWPRRTKCKEGNLSYFDDHWGYRHYDVVAQSTVITFQHPVTWERWSGRSQIPPSGM